MNLTIQRGQKEVRGKIQYSIWIQLAISPEERRSLELYGLNSVIIGQCPAWRGASLYDAKAGVGVEVDRFDQAVEIWAAIVNSFEALKKGWEARRSFTGRYELSA